MQIQIFDYKFGTHRDSQVLFKVDFSLVFCIYSLRLVSLLFRLPAAASSTLVPHLAFAAAASPSPHDGLLFLPPFTTHIISFSHGGKARSFYALSLCRFQGRRGMRDRRGQRLACSVDLSVGRPRPHLDAIFLLDGHLCGPG